MAVFRRLFTAFGPQYWWPARTPFEVVVGAILTQSVAWVNVEKAIANLDAEGLLTPEAMWTVPREHLAALIRTAGYYNAKADKLRAFLAFLRTRHGNGLNRLFDQPLPEARAQLLAVKGIGPETADSILLYAGDLPTFVIDAYTRRIMTRLLPASPSPAAAAAVSPDAAAAPDDYEGLRAYFQSRLPADVGLYNEYHALLVALGKDFCRKRAPRCGECPLRVLCVTRTGATP